MRYYAIKKGDLYYNEIGACYDIFMPWGALFPAHHIDDVWWKYLHPDQREGATIVEVYINEAGPYTPNEIRETEIGF